ncbi:transposase, partial [Arsenophonus sp.]|uniref:transposase n=1 Tax=Arsenophonus sp. TaxID=1872640 RepID=UPI00285BEE38
MPHLLWPFLTITGHTYTLFAPLPTAMLQWAANGIIEINLFCTLHTYGRQLNQHPHVHVSVTREVWIVN